MPEVFGSYIVHEELGTGGMATVHLAQGGAGAAYGKRVALKRLLPHVARVPELLTSFIDEARLARYLKHPNIAQVYEFGRISGVHFIAFEFVPGPTVEQLFLQCRAAVGPIPVAVVLGIATQLCDALEHAHTLRDETGQHLRIVHRDVSPSNLIVSTVGLVKLIDFGLAKAKYQTAESQAGIVKGKLSYTAPEYIAGQLDARCDLWAVGVVLHELLTGQRLFASDDDASKVMRIQSMPIVPPSQLNAEVSRGLDSVVLTALERDPARRWQSAADLRMALGANTSQYRELPRAQLVAWIEWAFTQTQRREDSGVSALHDIMESGLVEIDDAEDEASAAERLPASSAAMLERRRESAMMIPLVRPAIAPAAGEPVPARRRTRAGFWLALLLVAAAATALAYSQGYVS
jgi:serine/threonine-protein kinase